MVPMRDSVRLVTDVYRLDGVGLAPALLARTPYNKEGTVAGGAGVAFDVLRAVQAGYIVVIQDVRGEVCLGRRIQTSLPGATRWSGRNRLGGCSTVVPRHGRHVRSFLARRNPMAGRARAARRRSPR
jgi:X-Pro dipeptidyl-peptidase (S15 family)